MAHYLAVKLLTSQEASLMGFRTFESKAKLFMATPEHLIAFGNIWALTETHGPTVHREIHRNNKGDIVFTS
jgi:hypothetical protein